MGIEFPANGLSEVVDGAMVSLSINVQISMVYIQSSSPKNDYSSSLFLLKWLANKQFKMTQP